MYVIFSLDLIFIVIMPFDARWFLSEKRDQQKLSLLV